MNTQENKPLSTTKPSLFYGYIIVAAAFFVFMISFGIHNSFGVFFNPLIDEFGWTRALTSGAYSLSMVIYGLISILMGGLNDRIGPRIVVSFCGLIFGIGYLLLSQVNSPWHLYLFIGVFTAIGLSGFWSPLLSTITRWFVHRRSLMSGIVLSGMGIGSLVIPLVMSGLINTFDWRMTGVILGAVVLVIIILLAQLLRRDPGKIGQIPYGGNLGTHSYQAHERKSYTVKEAVGMPQFWLVFVGGSFCYGFALFPVIVHIVPHAIDIGISNVTAANILSAMGGASVVGNLLLGGLGDRIGNRWVYIIGFILMAVAPLWLLASNKLWMLFLFAFVFGLGQGGISAQGSPLVAKLFGVSSHGLIYAVVSLGFRVGAAVGPVVMGYIFDSTGGYEPGFVMITITGVVGIIMTVLLKPTKEGEARI